MPWTGKYQTSYCDECHKKWPNSYLVRKLTETGTVSGQNLFVYSSYNTALWEAIGTTKLDVTSMGPYMYEWDENTLVPGPGNSGYDVVEDKGSITFEGSGVVRSIIPTDISTMSDVLFGVSVGRSHRNLDPSSSILDVEIGYYDAGTTMYFPRKTLVFGNSHRLLFIDKIGDVPVGVNKSAADFYIKVIISSDSQYTNYNYWWLEDFHLANSDDRYEEYIPRTSGAIKIREDCRIQYGLPVLCPDCYDFVAKTYQPTKEYDQPWSFAGYISIATEGTDL